MIIDLATIISRTPSAVALKLVNFARLDPQLQKRNISGMAHGSKMEIEVWQEYHNDFETVSYESELITAKMKKKSILDSIITTNGDIPTEMTDKVLSVKVRIKQYLFRMAVLAAYNYKCCITGLNISDLLVASHIIPWSIDLKNRINPCNGLCMNTLHDKAYDRGLITIDRNLRLRLSTRLKKNLKSNKMHNTFFMPYENKAIALPSRFAPSENFLKYHEEHIFQK